MDFEFSEQQQMLRDTFRSFLEDRYELRAHVASAGRELFEPALWRELADLGLFALLVPEEHGGSGMQFLDVALVVEELGRALVGPLACETLIAADLLTRYGTTTQRSELLPRIAAGGLKVSTALTETQSAANPMQLATSARFTCDVACLAGSKILVPQAATADLFLVATAVESERESRLALIEAQRPGVSLQGHSTLDPSCGMAELTFVDVRLTPEAWLGGLAPTPGVVNRLFDLKSTCAALQMAGIGGKLLELSTAYAMERVQFGKPIGSFQAIKHKCADIAVAVEATRAAAYFAAWAMTETPLECAKAVSIAKSFADDAMQLVCAEGAQIHGGMGYTWELGLHLYLRRAKLLQYSCGDATYHRERLLAASLAELRLPRQTLAI